MGAISQQAGRPGGLRENILRRLVDRWCRYCTLCHAGRHIHKQRSMEVDGDRNPQAAPIIPYASPHGGAWDGPGVSEVPF